MTLANDIHDGVIILDSSFRSIAVDRGAEAILGSFAENGCSDGRLPREIVELLQSRSSQSGEGDPMYVNALGRHYRCRPFVVRPHSGAEPMLTLYLRREISIVDAAHQIAVQYHLTEREEETLVGLAMGFSGKEVASRMNISPNTVKAFVRLAMLKMGAKSRACVFAQLLERQAG